MKDKFYIKAIVTTIILSVFFFGVLTTAVWIVDKHNIGASLNITTKYDWLTFVGTIITGLIATTVPVCVMFYTMKEQNDLNRKQIEFEKNIAEKQLQCQKSIAEESIRLQIIPVLQFSLICGAEIKRCKTSAFISLGKDNGSISVDSVIRVKNIGKWHARKIFFYTDVLRGEGFGLDEDDLAAGVEKERGYTFFLKNKNDVKNYSLTVYYQDLLYNIYKQTLKVRISGILDQETNSIDGYSADLVGVSREEIVEAYPE